LIKHRFFTKELLTTKLYSSKNAANSVTLHDIIGTSCGEKSTVLIHDSYSFVGSKKPLGY